MAEINYPIPPEEQYADIGTNYVPIPRNLKEQVLNLATEIGVQMKYIRDYNKALKDDVPYLASAKENPSKVFLESFEETLDSTIIDSSIYPPTQG